MLNHHLGDISILLSFLFFFLQRNLNIQAMSLNYRFESPYVHSITANSLSKQLIDRPLLNEVNGQNGARKVSE